MALKRQRGIFAAHAFAIIDHTDQPKSTIRDLHGNALTTRIEAVVDQFLDHRSRPLYYLACRDPSTHFRRKDPNFSKAAGDAHRMSANFSLASRASSEFLYCWMTRLRYVRARRASPVSAADRPSLYNAGLTLSLSG